MAEQLSLPAQESPEAYRKRMEELECRINDRSDKPVKPLTERELDELADYLQQ